MKTFPFKSCALAFPALTVFAMNVGGQFVLHTDDFLHQVGSYSWAYVSTNAAIVSADLGSPGGPQHWNFSQPRRADEFILRTEVMLPSESGQQDVFPEATYAERETDDFSNEHWTYYRSAAGEGRRYYGFYSISDLPAGVPTAFDRFAIEPPDNLHLGQRWTWSSTYHVLIYGFPMDQTTVAAAVVDAYGALSLPELGDLPAWRVTECRTNLSLYLGSQIVKTVNTYTYWLVRGIGKAAQFIQYGNDEVMGTPPAFTNSLLRVYAASQVKALQRTVKGLSLRIESNQALLTWSAEPDPVRFEVECRSGLEPSDIWSSLTQQTGTGWSEPLTNSFRKPLWRVICQPVDLAPMPTR